MQRPRHLFDDGTDRLVALGHPGAGIEQVCHVEQRRHIDRHRRNRDEPPHILQRGIERRLGQRIAGKFAAGGIGNTDAQAAGHSRGLQGHRDVARPGVSRVIAAHHAENRLGIADRAGKDRNRVERLAGRHHAVIGNHPQRRFQPDDIVQPGRHPAGPCRIGTQRKADEPMAHHDTRTAARPARNIGLVNRIARYRPGCAHPDKAGRELVQIGLADQDRPGIKKILHRKGGFGRGVLERRAGRRRRHAGHVDIVLDREGNAPERSGGVEGAKRRGGHFRLRLRNQGDEDARIVDPGQFRMNAGDEVRRAQPLRIGRVQRRDRGKFIQHPAPLQASITSSLSPVATVRPERA